MADADAEAKAKAEKLAAAKKRVCLPCDNCLQDKLTTGEGYGWNRVLMFYTGRAAKEKGEESRHNSEERRNRP
jgi:hypothetical protein